MFQIRCIDPEIQKRLKKLEEFYAPEVCQELSQFLQALKKDGEVSRVDFFRGNINRISANTFDLYYISNHQTKVVTIIDIRVKARDFFKNKFSILDNWDDKDVIECIPQYDKPSKIIKALELINEGITDSYEIGEALGHKAKKRKDVARHGQYAQKTLEELKLIVRIQQEKKLIPKVTGKGKLIAEAPDKETKEVLLIGVMLNYEPVWKIVGAVTEDGEKLDDELVKRLVFPPEFQSSDTSNRRAQTLKNWVKWICKYQLIPIRLHDHGMQLAIPLFYAEKCLDASTALEENL